MKDPWDRDDAWEREMDRQWRVMIVAELVRAIAIIGAAGLVLFWVVDAHAQVPATAQQYRADLTRQARMQWGLSAPVADFAAQIHQESAWRADAVSRVGAQGMAQFMPSTARWWCDLHRLSTAECQPANPTWAIRALVGYDRWLWDRIRDGLTHVLAEGVGEHVPVLGLPVIRIILVAHGRRPQARNAR